MRHRDLAEGQPGEDGLSGEALEGDERQREVLGAGDETAVAVLRADSGSPPELLASEVSSQVDLHRLYGGVVPELASRNHMVRLRPLVDLALSEAGTPIAAIAGYAELYEAGGVEAGPGLDRAMARIGEASDRAGRLIEDLLALARLDREIGTSRSPMDLSSLVADIAEDSRISTGRDITADVPGPLMVNGDAVWLRQAIENLPNPDL